MAEPVDSTGYPFFTLLALLERLIIMTTIAAITKTMIQGIFSSPILVLNSFPEKIARKLYEQETITGEEFMELLELEKEQETAETVAAEDIPASAAEQAPAEETSAETFAEKLARQQENDASQENTKN